MQYHDCDEDIQRPAPAANEGDVSALCLLDLTAAFDTVDHDLLMSRLERQFGLRGVILLWFSSYVRQIFSSPCSKAIISTCVHAWLSSFVLCLGVPISLFFTRRICRVWLRHMMLTT